MSTRDNNKLAQQDANYSSVFLEVNNLSKSYVGKGNPYPAVANFSLNVYEGEIVALLGPSGCGKTTFLRLVAGFEVPQQGTVIVQGNKLVGEGIWTSPEKRHIGFVFQDYALFPHLDVLQNVAFGLKGMPRRKRLARAKEVIDLVGLTIFSKRHPHQLSGGQQQRVALARALARNPQLILLDEPFSNLDAALRSSTRQEVKRILKESGTTAILVTHDQEEAMTFADRLAVMRLGKLEQIASPEKVYLHPRTAFVASFLGTTNLIHGIAHERFAETPIGKLPLKGNASGNVLLSLRPENLSFDNLQGIPIIVISREFKGHDLTYTCETDQGEKFIVQTTPENCLQVGERSNLVSKGVAVPLEGSTKI